jgi:hypothetical protein
MAGYGDDSGFEAWAEKNGHTIPLGLDAAVLRLRGSEYIDGAYGDRFPGHRAGGYAQARAWPRSNAVLASGETVSDSVVPVAVINASYVAALADATAPGSLSAVYTPGASKVLTEVKGIKWQVIGDAGKDGAMVPVLTAVEGLLRPLLRSATAFPSILVV